MLSCSAGATKKGVGPPAELVLGPPGLPVLLEEPHGRSFSLAFQMAQHSFIKRKRKENQGRGTGEVKRKRKREKMDGKRNVARKQQKGRLFQGILQKLGLTRWLSVKRDRSWRTATEQYLPDTAPVTAGTRPAQDQVS